VAEDGVAEAERRARWEDRGQRGCDDCEEFAGDWFAYGGVHTDWVGGRARCGTHAWEWAQGELEQAAVYRVFAENTIAELQAALNVPRTTTSVGSREVVYGG